MCFSPQAAASSCPCEPLLKKVKDQVKATEEEVKLHILNVQKDVSRRLDRMEQRTRHQVSMQIKTESVAMPVKPDASLNSSKCWTS